MHSFQNKKLYYWKYIIRYLLKCHIVDTPQKKLVRQFLFWPRSQVSCKSVSINTAFIFRQQSTEVYIKA